jgi:hypothetical protein
MDEKCVKGKQDPVLFRPMNCKCEICTMDGCAKCSGTRWVQYDENHSKICDACCKHASGWWELKEHYGINNGKMCCTAGCGFVREKTPVDLMGTL